MNDVHDSIDFKLRFIHTHTHTHMIEKNQQHERGITKNNSLDFEKENHKI